MTPEGCTDQDIWNDYGDPFMGTFKIGEDQFLFNVIRYEPSKRINLIDFRITPYSYEDDPGPFQDMLDMERWIDQYQKDRQSLYVMVEKDEIVSSCLIL